jgi:hypothetical protein
VRPYLEKPFTEVGLVEWLKVKALSSNPSIAKKMKNKPGTEQNKDSASPWRKKKHGALA